MMDQKDIAFWVCFGVGMTAPKFISENVFLSNGSLARAMLFEAGVKFQTSFLNPTINFNALLLRSVCYLNILDAPTTGFLFALGSRWPKVGNLIGPI